jgi:iron only hydrogenase large subunit-like protein
VVNVIKKTNENRQVPVMQADTLRDCRKMLAQAKAGKLDGYLLEGMACPGGCVGGPGTLSLIPRAAKAVNDFAGDSPYTSLTTTWNS